MMKQQKHYHQMFLAAVGGGLLLFSMTGNYYCDGFCVSSNIINHHHKLYHSHNQPQQQYGHHHHHLRYQLQHYHDSSHRRKQQHKNRHHQQLFMVASSVSSSGSFSENNDHHEDDYHRNKHKIHPAIQSNTLQRQQRQSHKSRRNIWNRLCSNVMSKGTRLHLFWSTIMLIIPICYWNIPKLCRSCSKISKYSMTFSFLGMFYDNFINGIGKYLVVTDSNTDDDSDTDNDNIEGGEGDRIANNDNILLRRLTKGRYLFHAAVMPLVFLPILEVATFMDVNTGGIVAGIGGGLFKNHINIVSGCFIISLLVAIYECYDWLHYDSTKFKKVDQRYAKHDIQHHIVGTYKYTCPNILKCVLPAIITTLLQLFIGLYLIVIKLQSVRSISTLSTIGSLYSFLPSMLIFSAGCTALLSATYFSKKPQYQLVLEPLSLLMIWISSSCLY